MTNENSKSKRVFIFDPCFGNLTGHWENYCRRLYQEIVDRGYQVCIFGQKKIDNNIIKDIVFIPVFEQLPFSNTHSFNNIQQQTKTILAELKSIPIDDFVEEDLLIFHSIYPANFAAILLWSQAIRKHKRIKTALFFQFAPVVGKWPLRTFRNQVGYLLRRLRNKLRGIDQPKGLEWLANNEIHYYRAHASLLHELVQQGNYYLFGGTQHLTQNFQLLLQAPMISLPMPGPKAQVSIVENKKNSTIKVGYFGHTSRAKGGLFLRYFVEQAGRDIPEIRFIYHINTNKETENYLNYFKTNNYENLQCYFGHLGEDKLITLLNEVDIVLMPYWHYKYSITPSAIFMEAMACNKVVVIPEGTWLSEMAKQYDIGHVCFDKFNQQSVYTALVRAVNELPILQEKSNQGGSKFNQVNNIATYFDYVEQNICRQ